MQLIGYVIAAEESVPQKVIAAVILKHSANKQFEIKIDDQIKDEFFKKLSQLHQVLKSPHLPHSDAQGAKCEQCEYLRYCNDR